MVALFDALRLGEDGLRASPGQWRGTVGADQDAGTQVAAEQSGCEAGLEPVADGRGREDYGFLRESSGAGGDPSACRGHPGLRGATGRCGREGELAGAALSGGDPLAEMGEVAQGRIVCAVRGGQRVQPETEVDAVTSG